MNEVKMCENSDWELLDDLVERFEDSWRRQGVASLEAFVPAADLPHRQRVLVELVKVDQEFHWAVGQPRRLEDYLSDWPELRDDAVLLGLLEAECRTRAALGSLPLRSELEARFPDWAGRLDLDAIADQARADEASRPTQSLVDTPRLGEQQTHSAPITARLLSTGEAFGSESRYIILGVSGVGGMGVVYRARDELLKREVALKIPRRNLSRSSEVLDRFRREFQAAARLQHPNICHIYDAGQWQEDDYVTMEWIEGVPLSEWARGRVIAPPHAAELVAKISDALAAVHQLGIVHRDIKPGNVMMGVDGQPRLMDFGLAKWTEGEQPNDDGAPSVPQTQTGYRERRDEGQDTDDSAGDVLLTSAGVILGTVTFMSPEQTLGQPADERSDIFSVGVLLYWLLTGRCPFQGSVAEVLRAIRKDEPPAPARLRPGLPRALQTICLRAMAKHPDDRYPSAQELAADLRRYVQRSRRQPKRLVAACLLGLCSVLLAGIVVRIYHGDGPPTEIVVPEGSRVQVSADGRTVDVWPGDVLAAPPGEAAVPASQTGWRSSRYDLYGSSYYPFPSTRRTRSLLVAYPEQPVSRIGSVQCVRTADLNRDGYLQLVVVEGNTIAVYDRWARESWRRDPVVDSGVEIPAGRVPGISDVELIDLRPEQGVGIAVLAGSRTLKGWCQQAPMMAVVYSHDGRVWQSFPVLDGVPGHPDFSFDFNGDGRDDLVFSTAAYRHPHAVCIYDIQTGEQLWRVDMADTIDVGGIGDVNGNGQHEILLIGAWDSHVDPPVGDYDSDHCYAVLFDAQGQRLWRQVYHDCLNGLLADLNGDGIPQIVVIHQTQDEASVHVLDPTTGEQVASLRGLNAGTYRSWAVADLRGDGSGVQLALGDGRHLMLIGDGAEIRSRIELSDARVLAANDLNGDGRIELVVAQETDLVILDAGLIELARQSLDGRIQQAVISDLDNDGINEILIMLGEGEQTRLEILHFQTDQTAGMPNRTHPGNVVVALLELHQQGQFEQADELVLPEHRDAVRKAMKDLREQAWESPLKIRARTHVDDSVVELTDHPGIEFHLRFAESKWWITEIVLDGVAAKRD